MTPQLYFKRKYRWGVSCYKKLGTQTAPWEARKIETTFAYHEANYVKEFSMEEKQQPNYAVKSVFKNGRMPTREEYTTLWIRMIDQIERAKENQQFPPLQFHV